MREFEKKILLSKDEYDYLMEYLGAEIPLFQKPIIKQINYYFDSDDLSMNRKNTTCRIRLSDGKYKGMMKQHFPNSDKSIETEIADCNSIEDNAFTAKGLKLQGSLITERCLIWKDTNLEIVIDKNEYLGHTDYELEIEYAAEHEKEARIIFRILQDMLIRRKCFLAYRESYMESPNIPSKSNRFFKRKTMATPTLQKNETKSPLRHSINVEKYPPNPDSTASHNDRDMLDDFDPDDYMSDYYGSFLPDENAHML